MRLINIQVVIINNYYLDYCRNFVAGALGVIVGFTPIK
ncbi:hypothetical protein EV02_1899 [Prochlorococcus marinus str. SB]|uniref:Uncharacterized protein n=1 Tax=Prochlorococcus marinus str. SB TaxID=59926 RepID=A0A0A2B9A5_PROMR|nr:hypothetical protein EV02_1899 [Prochlorococcus marinus str. SB]